MLMKVGVVVITLLIVGVAAVLVTAATKPDKFRVRERRMSTRPPTRFFR